jgi:hypothetical protein
MSDFTDFFPAVTSVNGNTGAVETGIDWQSAIKTSNFTAAAGKGYFVDTTSAAITVTLPSSPTAGDELTIVDYAGTADTNNITITSSNNINSASDDVFINYERGGISMVYVDATQGWIAYNAANETASAFSPPLAPLTVDYLVVAGGGGSSEIGGGGGAGGLRTSYGSTSGGGASAETSLSLSVSTSYTVTVGAGGAGQTDENNGGNGANSVFSTITSIGGGGGAYYNGIGQNGGSGGGESRGDNGVGSGTANQGYAGGNGNATTSSSGGAGGGGGAAAVGQDRVGSNYGNGGVGLAVNILNSTNAGSIIGEVSGNDVYYAGGGGGGIYIGTAGTGGLGGGADGEAGTSGTSASGATNSGGGGGGGAAGTGVGGAGGSGVVILRYPNGYTINVGSGLTEALGSPFTESSDKISVFTAGTGNIVFSA